GGRDQPRPWIADPREAGVADERDPGSRLELREHLGRASSLVVLVVAEETRGEAVAVEEDPRSPRVLAEDEVGLRELVEDAERDVLEVADRRRADRERHQARAESAWSSATRAAPIIPADVPSSARTTRIPSRIGFRASRSMTS